MRLSQVTRCCDHNTPVRVEKKTKIGNKWFL